MSQEQSIHINIAFWFLFDKFFIVKLPKNKSLSGLSNALRNNTTLAEAVLWKYLQNKQCFGYHLRRQKVIGQYIVDFYCPKLGLVIEIDGSSHDTKVDYDENRDKYLHSLGLIVLHLDNADILHHLNKGMDAVESFMQYKMNKLNKSEQ